MAVSPVRPTRALINIKSFAFRGARIVLISPMDRRCEPAAMLDVWSQGVALSGLATKIASVRVHFSSQF